MGLRPTGDLGPYTIYTSKRRATVIFPRSPPLKKPSPKQIAQRNRWRATADAWATMDPAIRQTWQRAAATAGLRITGHNLYFWYVLAGDDATIKTIERQTSITLISY